jgi:effector-binding domain-containing protein
VIVENKKQLEEFLKLYNSEDSILVPITQDSNKHSVSDELSLLYVKLFNGNEYILPFNHSETLNIEIPNLESNTKKYTYDRKKLNHFIKLNDVIDINLLHYLVTSIPLYIDDIDTNAHHFFNMRYYKRNNINNIIPVLKHLEKCREIASILKDTIEKYEAYVNLSYNNEVLDNLNYIESNGLQTVDGMVYSEYNIYTSTGRPSNRFGGTNFAALNKTDGSRKPYVSRFKNGVLVEMDYDAYHLRLIADKIDYDLPSGSVHEHMAKFYGVDYEEAKKLSFQYLYGFIPQDVIQMNPYFSRVHDYIEDLWKEYNLKEFIVSDIYNRRLYKKNLSDMNANKLFNYTIQLMETENNMRVLTKLIPEIKDYKSKLILYSYDSFLLDYNMEDGLDYLKKVKGILEQDGKYPVKVSWGLNYHEMKDITEKFVD